jgi:hypothetical protein
MKGIPADEQVLLNGNPDFWIQDRIDRKFMIKLQKGYNIE